MNTKRLLLSFSILLCSISFSQNYSSAIGIKSGYPGHGSINFKKFTGSNVAVDILGGTNFSGFSKYFWIQCLFEYNKNIINGSGFNYYLGAGPSLGYYTAGGYTTKKGIYYSGPWGGVTGVIGIEHTFSALPLNMALEAGPYVNLMPRLNVDGLVNVAIRYAIQ